MLWIWWTFLGLALAAIPFLGACAYLAGEDSDALSFSGFLLGFVYAALALSFFGIALNVSVGRHNSRVSCRSYAQQTGRETRFVIRQTFDWDCLTRASDGRWISINQLRAVPR